ncbi:MAG: hypothetical protein U5Q03_16530 [Bacteroidota bacterium]|nr:hypothetical protein [Bacteroidota bacterium]
MKQEFSAKTKMLMQLHYSRLSEKDRRHYAALESLKLGRGGITYISEVLGVARGTIIQGRKEFKENLEAFPLLQDRQRRPGGGRKKNGKPS